MTGYRGKRLLDLIITVPACVAALPVMGVVALLIRLTSPGPILFRQTRIGLDGRPFEILKFRSMEAGNDDSAHRDQIRREIDDPDSLDPNADGNYTPDRDPRITSVGALLRQTSLDELPQLFNVLAGQMSLVGPRPLIDWEVEMIPEADRIRDRVRPGMTGLFQIAGRKSMTTPEMLVLDREYLERISLAEDLRILASTPLVILSGKGAV